MNDPLQDLNDTADAAKPQQPRWDNTMPIELLPDSSRTPTQVRLQHLTQVVRQAARSRPDDLAALNEAKIDRIVEIEQTLRAGRFRDDRLSPIQLAEESAVLHQGLSPDGRKELEARLQALPDAPTGPTTLPDSSRTPTQVSLERLKLEFDQALRDARRYDPAELNRAKVDRVAEIEHTLRTSAFPHGGPNPIQLAEESARLRGELAPELLAALDARSKAISEGALTETSAEAEFGDPANVAAGMQLIAENWGRRQQWHASGPSGEPKGTVVGLKSLAFRDPAPTEREIHTMLTAAVGEKGYATPVLNDQGRPIVATQPLWRLEFDDMAAREAFEARLSAYQSAQVGKDAKQSASSRISAQGADAGRPR